MIEITAGEQIEQWGRFELSLTGPSSGNPFSDVTLRVSFKNDDLVLTVDGYYDGNGKYNVRFMPTKTGVWRYDTVSNQSTLNGITGSFTCISPSFDNPGPVRVSNTFHFTYADGSRYIPFGTTCYAWHHQEEHLETLTLETLQQTPFNKLRMCVFPKHYPFNENDPPHHAFETSASGALDKDRFNPIFFQHLEKRVAELEHLGIEADLILFHPYDRWGYADMSADEDARYIRYLIARLAAFRNVWWSMANEYDLMTSKTEADWDRCFKIVETFDPYGHLRSIHNCCGFFDHTKPFITHCSIQNQDISKAAEWRARYKKPVIVDECGYEGDIEFNWGDLTPSELVNRIWGGVARGCYVGHGETYLHPEDILWWSKGGLIYGESLPRIRFLKQILRDGPTCGIDPVSDHWNVIAAGVPGEYYLHYLGAGQSRRRFIDLPDDSEYIIECINAWEMSVSKLPGTYSGRCEVPLPGKPFTALRIQKAAKET